MSKNLTLEDTFSITGIEVHKALDSPYVMKFDHHEYQDAGGELCGNKSFFERITIPFEMDLLDHNINVTLSAMKLDPKNEAYQKSKTFWEEKLVFIEELSQVRKMTMNYIMSQRHFEDKNLLRLASYGLRNEEPLNNYTIVTLPLSDD